MTFRLCVWVWGGKGGWLAGWIWMGRAEGSCGVWFVVVRKGSGYRARSSRVRDGGDIMKKDAAAGLCCSVW
ncbi:hypothetical protein QBC39DRAFT_361084 [Podospora conica]|nr:hypothetical protein QBC39DRAFT_361084 [Schizothecium conicum]